MAQGAGRERKGQEEGGARDAGEGAQLGAGGGGQGVEGARGGRGGGQGQEGGHGEGRERVG